MQIPAKIRFRFLGDNCTWPVAIWASNLAEGHAMNDQPLSSSDIEYIADMLRAVVWAKDDILPVSEETLNDLEASLTTAEAALRRAAAELKALAS